jgi:glycosyltransferase involved in cell wall biosynthesis
VKISLITVCYNSEKTIKDTLDSVLNQTYKNYEYIIIDGKSNDNTLNILSDYKGKFNGKMKFISEKDNGLYDAMNKGIKMSTGSIIGILNSDDILSNKDIFKKIADAFDKTKCDGIYSNLYIMDYETMTKPLRTFIAKSGNYKYGWYPPHPTLYLKKEVYNKYGLYNQEFRIAADYDFMIRIMKENVNLQYINDYLVYMRGGGVSTKGLKGYWKSFKESLTVLKKNKIRFPLLVNFIRTFNIFKQIFNKKNK